MSIQGKPLFEDFLKQHDQGAWDRVVSELMPSIHEVDQRATRIWFFFWPLWLKRALDQTEDVERLATELELKGNYRIDEQIDISHAFIYGHRYWPEVKRAVAEHASSEAAPQTLDLAAQVRQVAAQVASRLGVAESLLLGITAVAFMTLQQVGLGALASSPGEVHLSRWAIRRSPAKILEARAKNDRPGLFGFLKGLRRESTIRFNENYKTGTFKLIVGQELTTASMTDRSEHPYADSRCVQGEGPIPTECRSAACGTCWVGVLAGNENLSDVDSLEARRIKRFGYIHSAEPRPIIRLSCQTKVTGNATIVVPPWNGVFSRFLEDKRIAVGGASTSPDEETAIQPRRH